jgi:hypothetical protein
MTQTVKDRTLTRAEFSANLEVNKPVKMVLLMVGN